MDVDKKQLAEFYRKGDFTNFFIEAKKITEYVLMRNFYVYDYHMREEMLQECLENLWKKIVQGKVDPNKNLMSFIWTNSYRRIQEIFRKEYRRSQKVKFVSYEYSDLYDQASFASYRYMDPEVASALLEGVV